MIVSCFALQRTEKGFFLKPKVVPYIFFCLNIFPTLSSQSFFPTLQKEASDILSVLTYWHDIDKESIFHIIRPKF